MNKLELLSELDIIYNECKHVNWDNRLGQISSYDYDSVKNIISNLDDSLPLPKIGCHRNELTLFWNNGKNSLTISITTKKNIIYLHYAAVINYNTTYSTEIYNDAFSDTIINFIKTVNNC